MSNVRIKAEHETVVMVLPRSHPFLRRSDDELRALVGPNVTVLIDAPINLEELKNVTPGRLNETQEKG